MRKENGVWHIKENWFLRYFWGTNFLIFLLSSVFQEALDEDYKYPKTLCSLIWGSVIGLILAPLYFSVVVMIVLILFISAIFAVLFFLFEKIIETLKNVLRRFPETIKRKLCPLVVIDRE